MRHYTLLPIVQFVLMTNLVRLALIAYNKVLLTHTRLSNRKPALIYDDIACSI
jgi:hypothetical protein